VDGLSWSPLDSGITAKRRPIVLIIIKGRVHHIGIGLLREHVIVEVQDSRGAGAESEIIWGVACASMRYLA